MSNGSLTSLQRTRFDLVVCWRTSDLRAGESLVQQLSVYNVELLAVAQSCTSLME
jgi:hypothetical protein